ncbi:DUF2842 domain-containing protein [Sphingomonas canadensis]|uniref:DUF2842 domain-containing protein n=1 Tax=Sphingomonas canadensis TaxID=1219257 RepID=A0ABW3H6G1_9SPHN|nr:DUF2842 domain-containing protein [Sphingomonas canadensis]MCW3836785.1 DUF2842 domain-containing protein [Sphingomonas canadensis]
MSQGELGPSWRKPAGALLIVGMIVLLAVAVGTFATEIGRLPILVQLPVYVVAGIVWVLPLKPLLRWMETGRWRD